MPVCGIIAEFNPYHNGHQALIDAARKHGATQIVCVMSGNFVQRGSIAIADKHIRAKAALQCGADLILELPLAYAMSTAQHFAKGAVFLLNALGCVDMLAFGSECGSSADLRRVANAIDDDEVTASMRERLRDGLTFAKARELAVEQVYGADTAALLRAPNNILGIEYLRQMSLQGMTAEAFTMKRIGAEHHGDTASNGFASASYLRDHADAATLAAFVPAQAAAVYADAVAQGLFPADQTKLETAMLSHLRRMRVEELARLPDISEGLEHRMYAAIREAVTLDGLMQSLKTKRYTMARVRRLILSAFLGLRATDGEISPPYVRVLGFNAAGQNLLGRIKKSCVLPVSASLAELRAHGGACAQFAQMEEIATNLYGLSLPVPLPCGCEYTAQAIFLR